MQVYCFNIYDVRGKTERMSENRQLEQEGGRMKNGKLEPNDSDTLQSIYNKLTVNGGLREPLTVEEQVLLFSVSKWIKKNVEEKV